MNWLRRCGTCIQWNITQPQKEWNVIWGNMDELRDSQTKWSKSERNARLFQYVKLNHTNIWKKNLMVISGDAQKHSTPILDKNSHQTKNKIELPKSNK